MEGGKVKIEMKSRFGHAYITKIDEGKKWGKGGDNTAKGQGAYELIEKSLMKYLKSDSKINENAWLCNSH